VSMRRDDTKQAFAELKRFNQGGGALREFPEGDLHNRQVAMEEPMRHICSYVLMESQESVQAAKSLKQKDARALGRVMNRVQSGLRDLMEVTCPETDWLAKRACETQGCFGAMQVYDGMAGNMLMLFDKHGWDRYQPRLEDYKHIFGFHPKWHIYQSPGSMQVTFLV
jgi:galactokinase